MPIPITSNPDVYDPEQGLRPFYSNDPNKPFKFGVAYSYKQCMTIIKTSKNDFDIKNGERIADIGAASGYMDGAISVSCDSVDFYIQDVNTSLLNTKEFKKVVGYYTNLRMGTQTNTFHMCVGTARKTNLPEGIFDKLIMNKVFHELRYPDDMVEDFSKKLKPGGAVYIADLFSARGEHALIEGCNDTAYTVGRVVEMMNKHKFFLASMKNSEDCFPNILVFKRGLSGNCPIKNNPLESMINSFNSINTASDSAKMAKITNSIVKDEQLNRDFESWINKIGYTWLKQKECKAAIHVFDANVRFFPNSGNAYDSLAEAYMDDKQYEEALLYYTKSLEVDSVNSFSGAGKAKIKKLKELIEKK